MTQSQTKNQLGYRYQQTFVELSTKKEKAFIPFVVIGDPNAEQSLKVIKALINAGADALELGIPFSDPSADGVTIQMAALRALNSGMNTDSCINILSQVREYAPNIPIGLLLYGNLVFARGINKFYADMAKAGVDSVLIADLPIRESLPFRNAATKHNIAPIFIAPPNANEKTLKDVSSYSQGYTYVLSRAGVTGVDNSINDDNSVNVTGENSQQNSPAQTLINTLNAYHAAPPVIGFGISTPQQVKEALAAGASGAISGSAVVKVIEDNLHDHKQMLTELTVFVTKMKAATR